MAKKGIIQSRRIKGDLDPGLEVSRLFGNGQPAIAEQISDGYKLFGSGAQGIYAQSATQVYSIGAKRRQYGRTFRYSQAGFALAALARLVGNVNFEGGTTGHVGADGFEGAPAAIANIGSNYIDIADTAMRAANYYQDGMLVAYGVSVFHQYYIVASAPGTGVFVRCYLAEPVNTENILLATGVTAYRSKFSQIGKAGDHAVGAGFMTFLGVNLVPISANNFFWLQTRGPAIITPTVFPGQAANLRDVYANPADGTIADAATLAPPHQRVGVLLSATQGAPSAYGDDWVDLQLDD